MNLNSECTNNPARGPLENHFKTIWRLIIDISFKMMKIMRIFFTEVTDRHRSTLLELLLNQKHYIITGVTANRMSHIPEEELS